ncbi:MAG TPA: hypothetical protein VF772_05775 [Terriglobales bacterium]
MPDAPIPFVSLAVNSVFSSEYEPTTKSAPASRKEASEKLVVTPAEKQPAPLAATIPFTASSITKQAVGAKPSLATAIWKTSGEGFFSDWVTPWNNQRCPPIPKSSSSRRSEWQRKQPPITRKPSCLDWGQEKDARRFILEHPTDIDLRKVDQLWFLDVITNGLVRAA